MRTLSTRHGHGPRAGRAERSGSICTSMCWRRSSCLHARRWRRRLQSRQRMGSEPTTEMDAEHAHLARLRRRVAHAIGTVPAEDRGGNCGCWPHRPQRRLPSASRRCSWATSVGPPDNAACHLAGGQSLAPRSGQLSRASPPAEEHSPRKGAMCRWEGGRAGANSVVRTGSGWS